VPEGLLLTAYGRQPPNAEMARVLAALQGIEVHTPFEVLPTWVGRAHHRTSALRGSTMIQATRRLERLGLNLANAWHALRTDQGEAHWQETMELVRLGLGDHVESVNTRADAAGGEIALWVKLRGRDAQVPAAGLSEGMLSYLAFVALYRLPTPRSLLVFDEPELHLHPHLLVRVVDFFQSLSEQVPVVLSTHARRLLDALHDPVASVRVCELDPQGDTVLRGLDPDAMARWLEAYEGLGRILDAGYEAEVLQALEAS
jgi:predicted ATPase